MDELKTLTEIVDNVLTIALLLYIYQLERKRYDALMEFILRTFTDNRRQLNEIIGRTARRTQNMEADQGVQARMDLSETAPNAFGRQPSTRHLGSPLSLDGDERLPTNTTRTSRQVRKNNQPGQKST